MTLSHILLYHFGDYCTTCSKGLQVSDTFLFTAHSFSKSVPATCLHHLHTALFCTTHHWRQVARSSRSKTNLHQKKKKSAGKVFYI